MKESIKTLEAYNAWRRGDDLEQGSPILIGMAIDNCIKSAKRYELVRTLNVSQFKKLFMRCLSDEKFDDVVDEMIKERGL